MKKEEIFEEVLSFKREDRASRINKNVETWVGRRT